MYGLEDVSHERLRSGSDGTKVPQVDDATQRLDRRWFGSLSVVFVTAFARDVHESIEECLNTLIIKAPTLRIPVFQIFRIFRLAVD